MSALPVLGVQRRDVDENGLQSDYIPSPTSSKSGDNVATCHD